MHISTRKEKLALAKVVIEVKDKKDSDSCTVKVEVKNTEKASKTELNTLGNVYNSVCEALKSLQK